MTPLTLHDAFASFDAQWQPRVAFEVNDTQVKVGHCPVADEEADVVMIEPKSTLNVGNVVDGPVGRRLRYFRTVEQYCGDPSAGLAQSSVWSNCSALPKSFVVPG